eukprot:COSAG02_NODE_1627_length_11587_cov_2.478238_5_plen_168_part_00
MRTRGSCSGWALSVLQPCAHHPNQLRPTRATGIRAGWFPSPHRVSCSRTGKGCAQEFCYQVHLPNLRMMRSDCASVVYILCMKRIMHQNGFSKPVVSIVTFSIENACGSALGIQRSIGACIECSTGGSRSTTGMSNVTSLWSAGTCVARVHGSWVRCGTVDGSICGQ